MAWQTSLYLLPLVFGAIVSFALSFFAFRNREKRIGTHVGLVLLGGGIWATADGIRLATTDESLTVFWHNVRFLGSTLIVFSVFLFALEYANRERWLTRRMIIALGAPFVVTIVLVWTNSWHHLVRADVEMTTVNGLILAEFEYGPWFAVNALYSYVLLSLTVVVFAIEFVRTSVTTYRRQTLAILVATTVPWAINGLYLANVTLVDLTAFGLTVTGVMYYASLFWFELLELVPVARSTVVDHIEHGVLVVDTEDRVVDVNERGATMIGFSPAEIVGTTTPQIYGEYPEITGKFGDENTVRDIISMDIDGEQRHFDIDVSPLYSRTDCFLGRVILIRDVTDRRRRQEQLKERTDQLEMQNERLDQFASIVSHDLRNPLNVAEGYRQMAASKVEPDVREDLEEVKAAHERIGEIVEDVLTLARNADQDLATETVELAAVAADAWESIDAPQGSFVSRTERNVEADRSRLQQLLENLLRNAYDHGPADATISIGDLDDGFYVEDDGPGIPADERADVLEQGYTTSDEGTGLGLSIVTAIADAHEWSVGVTEGVDGGARFEVTGVADGAEIHTERRTDWR